MWASLRVFLLPATFALATACASNPRFQSDQDTSANFNAYRTYDFSSPTAAENPDFTEHVRLLYTAAIEQQMLGLGYARDDDPDILIDVSINLKEMTRAPKLAKMRRSQAYNGPTTACPDSGDYDGQIARYASSAGSLPTLCRFKEGSVEVDVLDRDLERRVWRGVLLVRIADKERSEYLKQNIVNDTNRMFEDTPFVTRLDSGQHK